MGGGPHGSVATAAGIVTAAGHHGHHLKAIGLSLLVIVVVIAIVIVVVMAARRRRPGRRARSSRRAGGDAGASPQARAAAIAAVSLSRSYQMGKVEVLALDEVSMEIAAGQMVCIMGRSGSGKSTLLRQLGLIDEPTAGSVWLGGREVTSLPEHQRSALRLRRLGYVFQEYALVPELTAIENVCLPMLMTGQPLRRCRARAAEVLETVGLGHRGRHRPREMSGGEQQRVAIARALANKPDIIFADEPTASLDSASAATVMDTLRRLNTTLGVTVVFVSHDPADAQYATRLIYLADGRLSEAADHKAAVPTGAQQNGARS
jgi:putative ABC transport system ATP-binding protein